MAGMAFIIIPLLFLSEKTLAQSTFRVTGKVTDEKGDALIGVIISVMGTGNGTSTNADGVYSLNAPSDTSTLVFRYLGYTPYQVQINKRNVINATLTAVSSSLQEVVVVGYGTQRKKDLT
ncbi:MAG: hypothetical protein JWR02_2508, partial [Mucilaginibacter sp.]|nr:hypothetical protein [Mucilaginibacter sp.]